MTPISALGMSSPRNWVERYPSWNASAIKLHPNEERRTKKKICWWKVNWEKMSPRREGSQPGNECRLFPSWTWPGRGRDWPPDSAGFWSYPSSSRWRKQNRLRSQTKDTQGGKFPLSVTKVLLWVHFRLTGLTFEIKRTVMDAKESVINSSEQLVIVSHSLPTGSPLHYLGKQRARKNWGEVKRRGGRGAGGEERRSFHLCSPRPPPPRLVWLAPVPRARCYQNQAESLWAGYVSQGAILWENFRSRLAGLLQLYLSVSFSLGAILLLVYLLGKVLCEVDRQTDCVIIVSLKFFFSWLSCRPCQRFVLKNSRQRLNKLT